MIDLHIARYIDVIMTHVITMMTRATDDTVIVTIDVSQSHYFA